jgi:lysophospholipase L1-like esterase
VTGGAAAVRLSPAPGQGPGPDAVDVVQRVGNATVSTAGGTAPAVDLAGSVSLRRPVALFIGDSYTAGSGGAGPERSFACLTARTMGWSCRNDGEPGTGYTNAGKFRGTTTASYPARVLRTVSQQEASGVPSGVDVVVVTGGRNDSGSGVPERVAAAGLTLDRLRVAYPQARIVVVGPFWVDDDVPPSLLAFDAGLRAEAAARHLTFLDPVRERWLTTAGRARWIDEDGVHPSVAGHQRIAAMLVAGLESAGFGAGQP